MRKLYFLMVFVLTLFMLPGQGIAATFTPECQARGAMWSNVLVDSYIQTTGIYGDPTNALGEVTTWATPSWPAFGEGILVSFNYADDFVVVGFEDDLGTPLLVTNNSENPSGYDFVIWGNAFSGWTEPGKVEVSQNLTTWHELTEGWTNRFDVTPTYGEGIVYPDSDLTTYAGGDYFDIASLGLDWIRYIRLSDDPVNGTADLDAIAALSTTAAPIPGAVWLLASGLLGLVGIRRRKSRNLQNM